VGDQPQVTRLQRQMLSEPRGIRDVATLQIGDRRIEGLENTERRDVDAAYHGTDGMLAQEAGKGFHLG
jgi:hypothetical protein